MKYNAIWISDLHLGSRHSQTELLLSFLHHNECRHLYLVGDIVDGWELRRRWLWTTEANTVIQKILRMNRKQTRVTYIFGNHDEFMQQFVGLNLGASDSWSGRSMRGSTVGGIWCSTATSWTGWSCSIACSNGWEPASTTGSLNSTST